MVCLNDWLRCLTLTSFSNVQSAEKNILETRL